jgi:hypothetical protein
LLETEILPPPDDKFAQVHLGRITLRGYSQMVIAKPAETSVQIAEPTDADEQEEKLDNLLPKLKFKLTKTSNVAVDGGTDGLYDRLAELQSGPIGAKPTAMTFRGLLMSKFHTLKPPSSAAFPRFYGLLLSRVYGNENIF